MIHKYLKKLGFSDREKKLYLTLAEIGVQPCSVIAKKCNYDRITTYKNLKKMAENGFIKIYYRSNIQYFGIESFENIKIHLKEKADTINNLMKDFPTAENLLQSIKGDQDIIPRLQIFQGESGIKQFFRDLIFEVKKEGLQQIRMLTSNTFDEQLGDVPLSTYIQEFYDEIKENKIDIEIFEAAGNLIPERINKIAFRDFKPNLLPAAHGTTNIFLAGHAVYIACYKNSQIGLKIKQSEMSQIFHFIFDLILK